MSECKDNTQRFVLCCKDRINSKSVREEIPEKYNLNIKNAKFSLLYQNKICLYLLYTVKTCLSVMLTSY